MDDDMNATLDENYGMEIGNRLSGFAVLSLEAGPPAMAATAWISVAVQVARTVHGPADTARWLRGIADEIESGLN
jgi:hypothetical protein